MNGIRIHETAYVLLDNANVLKITPGSTQIILSPCQATAYGMCLGGEPKSPYVAAKATTPNGKCGDKGDLFLYHLEDNTPTVTRTKKVQLENLVMGMVCTSMLAYFTMGSSIFQVDLMNGTGLLFNVNHFLLNKGITFQGKGYFSHGFGMFDLKMRRKSAIQTISGILL